MPFETIDVANDESSWWHLKTIYATDQLDDRIHKFMENFHAIQNNEDFAYEGIFDQKDNMISNANIKLDRSRHDMSQMINPGDKSNSFISNIYSNRERKIR